MEKGPTSQPFQADLDLQGLGPPKIAYFFLGLDQKIVLMLNTKQLSKKKSFLNTSITKISGKQATCEKDERS